MSSSTVFLMSEDGTPLSRAYMCRTSRPVSAPGSALNCRCHEGSAISIVLVQHWEATEVHSQTAI